jgi:putative aminopeptidase FrvX
MAIPELLDRLLRTRGPSGDEAEVAAVVREIASGFAKVSSDAWGNTVVRIGSGEPVLALVAHVDEIGLGISEIGDDGLLSVTKIAAFSPRAAAGQRVEIRTRDGLVPGVVAWRSREDKVGFDDLLVDIGAAHGDEARRLVRLGDAATLVAPPLELAGRRLASKSLDNRVCVYAALEALRRLADVEPPAVALVASTQEEIGGHGARVAAYGLRPQAALVLDVTYATDVPDANPREAGNHRLGGGPAIFRGPTIHPGVYELLERAATESGIPFSVETGMRTMTDADVVQLAGAGIPCGVLSVPIRYMHSAVEVADLSDVDALIELVVALARSLGPSLSFER